jgi:predicted alpha/beta hydrolase
VSTRGSARITANSATEDTLITTGSRWERWAQPRPFPGVRPLRTMLRTAHLIAFGTLYGGHVYGLPAERLWPALLATVGTGAALMGLEVCRLPLWLFQLRGVATLVKVVLVAAVAVCWSCSVWLLTAAIIIGSVAAHMPGRYRYYSVVHGRVIGGQESG